MDTQGQPELFWMSVAALTLALILYVLITKTNSETEIKNPCKKHDWSINPETNRLQCIRCNHVAE